MGKRYSFYYIDVYKNRTVMGHDFCNYTKLEQAIWYARSFIKKYDNVLEVIVYDTWLDVPILEPVFIQKNDELISLYQEKYDLFWKKALEYV